MDTDRLFSGYIRDDGLIQRIFWSNNDLAEIRDHIQGIYPRIDPRRLEPELLDKLKTHPIEFIDDVLDFLTDGDYTKSIKPFLADVESSDEWFVNDWLGAGNAEIFRYLMLTAANPSDWTKNLREINSLLYETAWVIFDVNVQSYPCLSARFVQVLRKKGLVNKPSPSGLMRTGEIFEYQPALAVS